MWPCEQPRENQEILIAGCGTSQAAKYALQQPHARVTAIDVSETSLRHTRDLQRKYNLDNLELHQLPIESVQELGRSFDLIVCTGVLHHLPDPEPGLRALREVLNPDGAMRLMVYAPLRPGRNLHDAGVLPPARCQHLGRRSAGPRRHARGAAGRPSRSQGCSSGRRISGCPRRWPTRCSIRRIAPTASRSYTPGWRRCGMSFGRWIEQAPYLPQCGMVAKSPHCRASSLAAVPSAARRGRAVPRNNGHAQLHRVPRRSGRRESANPLCRRSLARLRTDQACRGRCAFGSVCPPEASRC